MQNHDEVRTLVREQYGEIAGGTRPSCCGPDGCGTLNPVDSTRLGYTAEELASLPEGTDMGLGCGNPQAIAAMQPGETVLDLGSGAGFDAFLAAAKVGETGHVIGVDMTPEMITKARASAKSRGFNNVDFRLGEIEQLPVANDVVDVILSNCVINLSPEKGRVFNEAMRVLKPGGRLAISDVIALKPLPPELAKQAEALIGCVAGAITVAELEQLLLEAGFEEVEVKVNEASRSFIADWFPGSGAEHYVASATIEARKARAEATATGDSTKSEEPCCAPSCCA